MKYNYKLIERGKPQVFVNDNVAFAGEKVMKHNALWDAKTIKACWEKLNLIEK